jgi:butyryl-CoA dehydrogenase
MLRSNAEDTIRKSMALFVDNEVIPQAKEIDESGEFPREMFQEMAKMGVFGLRYPADQGGAAATPRFSASPAKNWPEAS